MSNMRASNSSKPTDWSRMRDRPTPSSRLTDWSGRARLNSTHGASDQLGLDLLHRHLRDLQLPLPRPLLRLDLVLLRLLVHVVHHLRHLGADPALHPELLVVL